jgi:Flp pilus assembly protein TadG
MSKMLRILRLWQRETKGSVMVEFALASLVFFLIVTGIIDLGHAYYMKQVVTNGSREGARYGVVYRTDTSGSRIAPQNSSPTIKNYLLNNYFNKTPLPSDANVNVTLAGAAATAGNGVDLKGQALEVTVTAKKTWIVLDNFIPSIGQYITLSATTVMQCE